MKQTKKFDDRVPKMYIYSTILNIIINFIKQLSNKFKIKKYRLSSSKYGKYVIEIKIDPMSVIITKTMHILTYLLSPVLEFSFKPINN